MKKRVSHMQIPWHNYARSDEDIPATEAALSEKASLIGRIGIIMLSCGTPAWRVRNSMTSAAIALNVTCTAEVGINSLNYTCIGNNESVSQSVSIPGISVNTYKLAGLEKFIGDFSEKCHGLTVDGIHGILDDIQKTPETHSLPGICLAAAFACAAFAFLLGAGPAEIICVFFGAGAGQLIRKLILNKELSVIISVAVSAAAACAVYELAMTITELLTGAPAENGAGYICAVLFLVPGFPFITSVLDLSKLDIRAGSEKLVYSSVIMLFATTFAWASALIFGFEPEGLAGLSLSLSVLIVLRLFASFVGIYGFSMMFNSTHAMALTAAIVGTVPNTLRIILANEVGISPAIAAFAGAFLAGILAIPAVKITSLPRAAITVPAVIVSVPGFFMYQSIYYFGTGAAQDGLAALVRALGIILATAMGILFSRFIADPQFRHRD